jgi:hypothetical protein
LALVLYLRRRAKFALIIMIASLPLLHEIFLSGRRQFLLPALIRDLVVLAIQASGASAGCP